jgi:hypothetical protein
LIGNEGIESMSTAAIKFMRDNYTVDAYKEKIISFLQI